MNTIYLDHHSITKPDEHVIAEMLPYLKEKWGAYSQPHLEGQKIVGELEEAFGKLAHLIHLAEKDTLVFTSSKVEAIHHVYDHIYRQVVRETGRNHFITLNSEEAPVLMGLKRLESFGCHTSYLEADQSGAVKPEAIIDAITPRTALVTLTLAQGLTGVIQSLDQIKEVCNLRGILIHLDVTYAFGKMEVDFQELGVDFITFGGEVLHGPKSSGLLVAKESAQLTPFMLGGQEQNGLRGGHLDTSSFMGFVMACELMKNHMSEMNLEVARLRDLFEKKITQDLMGAQILFKQVSRLCNVSVISFENVHADCLLYALNKRGVRASMGGNSFQKLSCLLENMGFPSQRSNTAISFSFSRENTLEDVKNAVGILVEEVKRLRLMTQKLEPMHATT